MRHMRAPLGVTQTPKHTRETAYGDTAFDAVRRRGECEESELLPFDEATTATDAKRSTDVGENTQRSYSVCCHQSHSIFDPILAVHWKQSVHIFTSATAKNKQAREGHRWPIVLT